MRECVRVWSIAVYSSVILRIRLSKKLHLKQGLERTQEGILFARTCLYTYALG